MICKKKELLEEISEKQNIIKNYEKNLKKKIFKDKKHISTNTYELIKKTDKGINSNYFLEMKFNEFQKVIQKKENEIKILKKRKKKNSQENFDTNKLKKENLSLKNKIKNLNTNFFEIENKKKANKEKNILTSKKNEELILKNHNLKEKIQNLKNSILTKTKLYSEELENIKKNFEISKKNEKTIIDLKKDKKILLELNSKLEKKLNLFKKDLEKLNNNSHYDIRKNFFLEMISQKETLKLFSIFIKKIKSSKNLQKKIKDSESLVVLIDCLQS